MPSNIKGEIRQMVSTTLNQLEGAAEKMARLFDIMAVDHPDIAGQLELIGRVALELHASLQEINKLL